MNFHGLRKGMIIEVPRSLAGLSIESARTFGRSPMWDLPKVLSIVRRPDDGSLELARRLRRGELLARLFAPRLRGGEHLMLVEIARYDDLVLCRTAIA